MRRNDAESETLLPIAWDEEISAHEDISGTVTRGGDGGRHAGVAVPFSFLSNMGSHTGGIGADICPTMLVQKNGGGGMPAVATAECADVRMAVRRLTPRECERLQGFPDDYTNIPGAADGPRYKALGNSMAVPVMRWIGKRIKEAFYAR